MVDFYEIIISSLEWTAAVLFRPFRLKKWFFLALLAVMTGLASCQLNLNIPTPPGKPSAQPAAKSTAAVTPDAPAAVTAGEVFSSTAPASAVPPAQTAQPFPFPPVLKAVLISMAAVVVLVVLAFVIVWTWLGARCTFVFLADIARNDASIVKPFRAYAREGNSLFKLYLVYTIVFLGALAFTVGGCFLILSRMGVFVSFAAVGWLKIVLVCLPFVLILCVQILAAGVFGILVVDLVAVIMAADRCGFIRGWHTFISIFRNRRGELFRYILFRFTVILCQAGITAVMLLMPMLAMVMVWGPVFFLASVIPPWAVIVLMLVLIPVAVPVVVAFMGIFVFMQLPLAVFVRAAGMKFMARIKPEYNLFYRLREEGV